MTNSVKESKLVYDCNANICWRNKDGRDITPPDRFMLYLVRKADNSFCGTAIGSRKPGDIKIITIENKFISFTKGNIKYSALRDDTNDSYIGRWEDDEGNESSFRMHSV